MPRNPDSRDLMDVDWPFFGEVCRALALRVAREYDPEIVLGVAKAGVIPGVVVASILQREFASITVTRHDDLAAPQLISGPPDTLGGRRVLIVDETCDSGDTLKLALNEVRQLHPADVKTAESCRTGGYAPNFRAFQTDKVIVLPWDSEVVQDGELVIHPDFADKL